MNGHQRFQTVHLGNWKNFAQAEVDLAQRVFLVGANAAGKSNFLDAFRFLREVASPGGGLREAVRRRGGVSAIRCLAARRHPDVTIRVRVTGRRGGSWEYELAFNQDNQRQPLVQREIVKRDGDLVLERPDPDDERDPVRLTQTHLEQVGENQAFRGLAEFFTTVRYLHLVPQLVREPDRSVGRSGDPYGGDFLEQIAKIQKRTREARLRRIRDALRVAVPQLEEIELTRDERGAPHLRGKYKHWRPQGAWQSENQFSDGTLRLMGLLWVVMDGRGPLLLEEPELSLHSEIVRVLPQMLARAQRKSGRQVLVSTHSPDLLRDEGIGLDEVLLLLPSEEGTRVEAASTLRDARDLLEGGLSLADIVVPKTRPGDARQLMLFSGT